MEIHMFAHVLMRKTKRLQQIPSGVEMLISIKFDRLTRNLTRC